VKVAIAEDNSFFREGLERLLSAAGVEVSAVHHSGHELLAHLKADDLPDVVIIDIRMPPTHTDEGLAVAAQLRRRFPKMAVLVLSAFVEPSYATRLLADSPQRVGMLSKEHVSDLPTLLDALRRLALGEVVIDHGLVAGLFAQPMHEQLLSRLTERETTVLRLMAEGHSNGAIAEELHLAERTVETHTARIFEKLQISPDRNGNRRVRAVLFWLKEVPQRER